MQTESLVPVSAVNPRVITSVVAPRPTHAGVTDKPAIEPLASLDELLANAGPDRGWRDRLRVAQVGRVLGLLTLYSFLIVMMFAPSLIGYWGSIANAAVPKVG